MRSTDFNPDDTIQSQYAASRTICALIASFFDRINPGDDIELFFDKIFNVMTAEGCGLDIWGRIVGANRTIAVPVSGDVFFGFALSGLSPFNQAPFYNADSATTTYIIPDAAYRQLILWRAMANIASADACAINRLLSALYDGKSVYVIETGIMQVRLIIEDILTPYEQALLSQYGIPALGAGVGFDAYVAPYPTFGFDGSGLNPFDNGTFISAGLMQFNGD